VLLRRSSCCRSLLSLSAREQLLSLGAVSCCECCCGAAAAVGVFCLCLRASSCWDWVLSAAGSVVAAQQLLSESFALICARSCGIRSPLASISVVAVQRQLGSFAFGCYGWCCQLLGVLLRRSRRLSPLMARAAAFLGPSSANVSVVAVQQVLGCFACA
jgi:hypothetical protein